MTINFRNIAAILIKISSVIFIAFVVVVVLAWHKSHCQYLNARKLISAIQKNDFSTHLNNSNINNYVHSQNGKYTCKNNKCYASFIYDNYYTSYIFHFLSVDNLMPYTRIVIEFSYTDNELSKASIFESCLVSNNLFVIAEIDEYTGSPINKPILEQKKLYYNMYYTSNNDSITPRIRDILINKYYINPTSILKDYASKVNIKRVESFGKCTDARELINYKINIPQLITHR